MLEEHRCRQPETGRKHWFTDSHHDLFVWRDAKGDITGFQFCYNKPHNEHQLSWSQTTGFSHDRVDDGEDVYLQIKMSPVLVANGAPDIQWITESFRQVSACLETTLMDFILGKLQAFPIVMKETPN